MAAHQRRAARRAGDAQKLGDGERAKVQRLDRAIQSYERLNNRTHKVYVAVELPDNHRDVRGLRDLQRICVPARQWPSINSHSLGTTCTKRRGTTVIGTWCSRLSPAAECIWADLTALRTPPTFCLGACNSRSPLPTTHRADTGWRAEQTVQRKPRARKRRLGRRRLAGSAPAAAHHHPTRHRVGGGDYCGATGPNRRLSICNED